MGSGGIMQKRAPDRVYKIDYENVCKTPVKSLNGFKHCQLEQPNTQPQILIRMTAIILLMIADRHFSTFAKHCQRESPNMQSLKCAQCTAMNLHQLHLFELNRSP